MQLDDHDPFRFRQNHALFKLLALACYCVRDVLTALAHALIWTVLVSLLVYHDLPALRWFRLPL
jgi:hypothetical protein